MKKFWISVDKAIDGLTKAKKAIDTALEVLSQIRNKGLTNGKTETNTTGKEGGTA